MRVSLLTWGAAVAFSCGLFLSPHTVSARNCSIGTGFFYSCDFKDDAGNASTGSLLLQDLGTDSGFFSAFNNGGLAASGTCDCQLQGTTKDNGKPPKDNTAIICSGTPGKGLTDTTLPAGTFSAATALIGKISGNPNKPETLKVKGQVHNFNGAFTVGYLFSCENTNE